MPRFFVPKDQISDGLVRIIGEDAHHIARSLRMAAGEHITVCDMAGSAYDCRLCSFEDDRAVVAQVMSVTPMTSEPPLDMILYQGLPKGDKLETVIQKAVECGIGRIVPFESANCVVKVKPEAEDKRRERRCRISTEAAKQCGRGTLPPVEETVSFAEMLEAAAGADLCLFCYEGEGTLALPAVLRQHGAALPKDRRPTLAIVVGSEGGFTPAEARRAREAGCILTGLGPRILRTETVAPFILGAIAYEFEL